LKSENSIDFPELLEHCGTFFWKEIHRTNNDHESFKAVDVRTFQHSIQWSMPGHASDASIWLQRYRAEYRLRQKGDSRSINHQQEQLGSEQCGHITNETIQPQELGTEIRE